MSHLVFRTVNHLLRTLAKPVIKWLTEYKKLYLKSNKKQKGVISVFICFFINFGQLSFQMNNRLNKKVFNLRSIDLNKKLHEDKALEKGIEMFYEVFFYSLIISVSMYEYYKLTKTNKGKSGEKQLRIKQVESELKILEESNKEIREKIRKLDETVKKELEIEAKKFKRL